MSSAERCGSVKRVSARPSGFGAKRRTGDSSFCRPWRASRRAWAVLARGGGAAAGAGGGAGGAFEAGMKFLGAGGAADEVAAFEDERLVAFFREVESGDERVVTATENDDVARSGHG